MRLTEINYKIEELNLSNASIKFTEGNTLSNLINFKNLLKEIEKYELNTDLQKAKELLGHNPTILGEVIHGKKIGRTLGFPTANLKFENKVYPSYGAYGVYVHIFGDPNIYHGVMNIGTNPTLKPGELSVEVHILDFNKDIYGETIKIEILEKISDEIKFTTVEDLIEKINNDVKLWRKRIDEKYGNTN